MYSNLAEKTRHNDSYFVTKNVSVYCNSDGPKLYPLQQTQLNKEFCDIELTNHNQQ